MMESKVCLGDIYQVGEAVVQISQGKIPCQTISKSNQVETFLDRIVETGYTGYFCRVLREGVVKEGSKMSLLERHSQGVTVLFANQIFFHEQQNKEGIEKILAVKGLAPVWRDQNRLNILLNINLLQSFLCISRSILQGTAFLLWNLYYHSVVKAQ